MPAVKCKGMQEPAGQELFSQVLTIPTRAVLFLHCPHFPRDLCHELGEDGGELCRVNPFPAKEGLHAISELLDRSSLFRDKPVLCCSPVTRAASLPAHYLAFTG